MGIRKFRITFKKNKNPYTYNKNQKVFLDAKLDNTLDPLNINIYENGDIFLNSIKINEPTLKNYLEIRNRLNLKLL